MIDLHCHILPGLDDGAGSLDECHWPDAVLAACARLLISPIQQLVGAILSIRWEVSLLSYFLSSFFIPLKNEKNSYLSLEVFVNICIQHVAFCILCAYWLPWVLDFWINFVAPQWSCEIRSIYQKRNWLPNPRIFFFLVSLHYLTLGSVPKLRDIMRCIASYLCNCEERREQDAVNSKIKTQTANLKT